MKMRQILAAAVAVGLMLVGPAHADPNESGPDLRYGGSLLNFQPELTLSKQVGNVEVRGWNAETIDLEIEQQPIEYRNGSEDITVRKFSGLKKFANIYVKRAAPSGR
jgi:hypothetical protein